MDVWKEDCQTSFEVFESRLRYLLRIQSLYGDAFSEELGRQEVDSDPDLSTHPLTAEMS